MRILCFGDSNTLGWDPRSYFGDVYDQPWPLILAQETGHRIRTDAACGRRITALSIPKDTELLILMLGTNDLLQGDTPQEAAEKMDHILSAISGPKVLLLSPPPLIRGEWVPDEELIARSRALAGEYRSVAAKRGVRFQDTGEWDIPLTFDGVHFTEEGHRRFAEKLREVL